MVGDSDHCTSVNHWLDPRLGSIPIALIQTYNPRQKSWHACPLLQYLSKKFISSPPPPNSVLFIVTMLLLLVSNIERKGPLIPVMPLVIVSKIACQRVFQLSDVGMPRTFVEDCRQSEGFGTHGSFIANKDSPPPSLMDTDLRALPRIIDMIR